LRDTLETPHDATAVGFCLTRKSSVSPIADVHNQTRFFNMARLILNCEGGGFMMSQFSCDIVMIGRSPSNQIVIDHPTVSAHHAVLLRTGASYSLKDLNSMKGTQINGDFVTDAKLKEGDTIQFGSVTAVFAEIYRKQRSTRAESGRSFLT